MSARIGFALAVGVLLSIRLGDQLVGDWAGLPDTVSPLKKEIDAMPMKLGQWTGMPAESNPEIDEAVGAECIVNRQFTHAVGVSVNLHCAVWTDFTGLPHDPHVCYRGAGYNVDTEVDLSLRASAARVFKCRLMGLTSHTERKLVLYWYQLGESVIVDSYDLKAAYRGLRGHDVRPPLVKVMLTASQGSALGVDKKMEELAQLVFEWLDDSTPQTSEGAGSTDAAQQHGRDDGPHDA